jgi:hypothetical protein
MRYKELCFILGSLFLFSLFTLASEDRVGETKIVGRVESLDFGKAVRIGEAKVSFSGPNGLNVTTTTSERGEYTATLPRASHYTVTVTATGFCTVHRPQFTPATASHLRFDFTITAKCPGDVVVAGDPELYYETSIPAYFEESIPLKKPAESSLIISFGKRTKFAHRIEYASLPVGDSKGLALPVTLAIGTYTIRAQHAELDRDSELLLARGEVLISDGSERPSQKRSCVALRLSVSNPKTQDCPQK